jgi:hypothetical protein
MSQVPLGIIHNGPLQTLHTPDGKSVDNDCWFDPDFMGDRPLFNSRGSWPVIEEKRQFVMGQLAVLKYRLDLPALRSLRWLTYPLPRRELGQAENRG